MGNGYSDSSGLRIVEEECPVEQIRREKQREQEAKLAPFRKKQPPESNSEEEILKFYGTRENLEDLTNAVTALLNKYAREQVHQVPAMLRQYRGMEEKLYDALENMYGEDRDFEQVDFDLDRLPFKGNLEKSANHIDGVAQWVQRVSSKVTRVQAKVRAYLVQKRTARARGPRGSVRASNAQRTDTKAADVHRTNSQDISMLTKAAFPEVDSVEAAKPAPKERRSVRRRRRRNAPEQTQQDKKAENANMANITVSNCIKKALEVSQISAELLFFMHDDKNTGRINASHFLLLCRQDLHISRETLSDVQIQNVFKAMDTSGDGEIQLEEMESFLKMNAQLAEDTI